MKDKSFRNLIYKYVLLSDFNRGLFWGIIFAWTAVISGIFGATATKVVYLDQQQTIVVQNKVALSKNVEQGRDISLEKSYLSGLNPNFALLSDIYADNSVNLDLIFPSKYLLRSKLQFDLSVIYPESRAKFAVINTSTFVASNDSGDNFKLKSLPIIIQNQTNNPKLALEIYSYLQEREFKYLAIANNLETKSYLSQTTIITPSVSLEAANHLQNILNLGIIELASDPSLDEANNSEIILNLGEDAKVFSYNKSFIYSAE